MLRQPPLFASGVSATNASSAWRGRDVKDSAASLPRHSLADGPACSSGYGELSVSHSRYTCCRKGKGEAVRQKRQLVMIDEWIYAFFRNIELQHCAAASRNRVRLHAIDRIF